MYRLETWIGKAFVGASAYLLVIILGGFFILPGVFQIDDYNFSGIVELLLKITSALAVGIVLSSAILIPVLKLTKSKTGFKTPVLAAALTLLIGTGGIFLSGVYAKLRSCTIDDESWACNVDGIAFVGALVLVFFLASLVGVIVGSISWFKSKKHSEIQ